MAHDPIDDARPESEETMAMTSLQYLGVWVLTAATVIGCLLAALAGGAL